VVISEAREDFEPGFDLSEHSLLTRQPLTRKLRVVGFRGPETREVRGFAALQYEFDAFAGSLYMTYLHTTIQGDRAFHQVLGWAPHSRFDRATFEQLLDSFTEIPRSDPGPAVPYVPQLPGHYEVH
jgi:hypothetical protein